jgi:hypothetical protein
LLGGSYFSLTLESIIQFTYLSSCDLSSTQYNKHPSIHPTIMLCCFQSCFDDPQSAYSQQASSDDIVVRSNAGGYPGQRQQFIKTGGNALAAADPAAHIPQATAPASPQPPATTSSPQQQQQQPTDGELVSGKLL